MDEQRHRVPNTDKWMNNNTDGQKDRGRGRQTDRQADGQTDGWAGRQAGRQQAKMLTAFLSMAMMHHIAGLTCWQQEQHWQAGTQPQPQQGTQRWCLTGFCTPPGFCCPAHLSHMPPRRAATTIGQPNFLFGNRMRGKEGGKREKRKERKGKKSFSAIIMGASQGGSPDLKRVG